MKQRSYSPYKSSEMARVKPRKRRFFAFIDRNLKRPKRNYTETGLVEDATSSTTVVRMIVCLLLIHLLVIGGVILHGKMKSADAGPIAAPTITAPPTPVVAAEPAQNDVLPQPVDGPVANPVRTEENHITQAPEQPAEATTAPVISEPEIVAPVVAVPAEPEQPAEATTAEPALVRHLVASGETLYGIAAKHQTTVEAIRKANPQVRNSNIISGTYLNIPVKADSEAGRQIAAQQAAAAADEAAKSYTIKRGDTLARIARKHKTTVAKLMELNNIPKGKEGAIRVGDTLRIAQ